MGMSSSQARLLSLTGRMHDIELKSQRIQAEKLRLANESDKVYTDYLNVLDAKKVQYRSINADGAATFIDATLARLENGAVPGYAGETSDKTFLIKNAGTNEIYVTPEFASAYGISATGDVSNPGSLEDYLTANGAHKREIMTTVIDYSDIQSVNPVENVKVSEAYDQLVTDPDTYDCHVGNLTAPSTVDHYQTPVYGISGAYTPASGTAGSVSYNVTNNIPNTMSVSPYSEVGNMKDVVTAGTLPSGVLSVSTVEGTPIVDKDEFFIASQTYQDKAGVKFSFNSADLSKTLGQLNSEYSWGLDFSDSAQTTLNCSTTNQFEVSGVYGLAKVGTASNNITFNSSTTLQTLLSSVVSAFPSGTFSLSSGTLSTSNRYAALSTENSGLQNFLDSGRSYIWGASHTFSLNTTMLDYLLSSFNPPYGDINIKDPSGNYSNNVGYSYSHAVGATSSKPPVGFTYQDYFQAMQNSLPDANVHWTTDSEGLHLFVENGYKFKGAWSGSSLNTQNIHHTTQTNTITVNLNLGGLAEDIYLARSIVAQKTPAEYSTGHDTAISGIISELSSAYGSYATDENKRQVTLFAELLQDALNSYNSSSPANPSILTTALAKLGTAISSDKYLNVVLHDDEALTEKNEVTYNFTNTSATITPSTTQIPDESTSINKGEIKNAPSNDDMKEYLAKAMYDSNNAQSYEDYLAKLNGFSLNSYELAIIYNNRSNSSLISKLVSSSNKSDVMNWINSNLDSKYHSDKLNSTYYSMVDQSSSNQYTCTNTSTSDSATSPSRTDIIKYLAYQMHSSYPEKTPAEWETYITNKFGSSGWNYSDKNVASISKNYAANSSDILSKLKSGTQLTSYINSFDDYSLTMSSSNNLSFTTTMVGTDEHYVNMDSASDIATRLASDIYAVNPSINPNDVRSQIMSTFSNQQLASLSSYYGTSNWNTIVNALAHYINTSAVSSYINNYNTYSDFRPSASNDFSIETVHNSHLEHHRGRVNIPKIGGIASNLVVAFRKAGYTVEESEVNSRLYALYDESTAANSQDLANINDATCKYLKDSGNVSYIQNIYNKLFSGSSLSIPTTYSTEDYVFDRSIYGRCQVQYGTDEVGTGIFEWVHDDLYDELVSKWNSLKQLAGNKFVIVTPAQASSYEFVRNLICETGAFLLEFNSSITEMRESSLAVEPTLKEVSDEKDLKRAEADYEAKMRRINQKDTKYDQELASCDTERNAIKQEMDTLKNVMKNNVDLSFKLFS